MNPSSDACPSVEDLRRFLTGRLNVAATDQLATHVETCPNCQNRMEQFDGTDASVDATVGEHHQIAFTDESHCDRVLEAIASGNQPIGSSAHPQNLGDYALLEPLGQGGMGMVYRASHTELGTVTAVKILQPHRQADQATIDRFEREMVAIGKLDHPNIVRALDAGEDAGQHYLVMEYVDGFDLNRVVNTNGSLSVADAAEVVRQAAMGLSYVHRHGRVHRDIKPSNLILARDGIVKVMDLGLARVEEYSVEEATVDTDDILGGSTVDLTRTHQVMGTPEYMPPEQVIDSSHVDHRADIYSLGCTLYKLLTGHSPMASSGSVMALNQLVQRVQSPSIPVRQKRPDVPPLLSDLLDRMLAKSPEDRPQTAEEIAGLLRPFAAGAHLRELVTITEQKLDPAFAVAETRDDFSTANDDNSAIRVPTPSAAKPDRGAKYALAGAAAILMLVVIVFVSSLPYSPTGTVVVQAESPEVAELLASGAASLVADDWEVPLNVGTTEIPAGRYLVSTDAASRLKFSQSIIDLEQDQQLVLSVSRATTGLIEEMAAEQADAQQANPPEPIAVAASEEPSKYEPVNLISLVDPTRDIRGNDWRLVDGALISNPDSPSMMMFPYQPPDEYRLELIATRLENDESLQLGLVADNRPVILAIDTYPSKGFLSGLDLLDGIGLAKRSSQSHQGQLLPLGRPVPIVATLRRDGQRLSIDMTVGDTSVLSWRGSISQAAGVGAFPPPQPGFLFLANWTASIKVSDLRVVPLSGDGTVVSFTDPQADPQRAAVERVLWNGGAVSIVDQGGTLARTPPTVVGGFELIRSFQGHTGAVKSVAVSPDGTLAASGSGWPNGDRTIRIWDVETGEQLHVLDHGGNVMSVAFSNDGQHVIASGESPELTLWDVNSGELLRTYAAGDARDFGQVSFTPDGTRIIVTTGRGEVVYAIETESGEVLHRWDVGSSALCFAVSPDSSRLAIGLNDTAVRVVDLESGETMQQLAGPTLELSGRFDHETYALDIAPDGNQIAAGYKANAIRVWDLDSGRTLKDIQSPVYGTEQLKFTDDSQQMIVTGFAGITSLVDIPTGQVLGTTPLIPGHSWAFALLPDGERILTGGGTDNENGFRPTGDFTLRLWKMNIADSETRQQPSLPQRPTIRIDRWTQIPSNPQVTAIDAQKSIWFDDSDIAVLANLPELESLDLSGTGVSATGIVKLGDLPNLTSLSLAGTSLRDVPLKLAECCPALKILDLQNTLVSDSSVTALNGFKRLSDLDFSGTRLTQDGLSQLETLSELESLSLAGTSIRRLGQLTSERFPRLNRLNLLGSPTSKAELDALGERMPELEIISGHETVDLIALVDVDPDSDSSDNQDRVWRKEGNRLTTAERTWITWPIVLPAEFDFKMTASRITMSNTPLIIGFAIPGEHHFAVGFDHEPKLGFYTILHGIDGMVDQRSPAKVQGETFSLGAEEPVEVEIRVRNKDKIATIQVLRNGTEVLRWQGDEARLNQTNSWWKGPNTVQPWVRQFDGAVAIKKLTVTPISGPVTASFLDEVSRFAEYPALKLDLRDRDIDDAGLQVLLNEQLPTDLTLQGLGITDASIDLIAANRQLRYLAFYATAISEAKFERLADMPSLERIEFFGMPQITDDVTTHLASMPSLKHVVFKHCSLYGPGLERLHDRPIMGLNLAHPAVDAEVLERYALPLHNLEVLDLAGAPIDDEAMALFPRFENLTSLHLGWNQTWKGPGLEYLKQVPTLRRLFLDASAVDDAALKHLAGATQIRELFLKKTTVSDASIDTLVTLTGLESLYVEETRFTAAGIEQLKALMPQVAIKFDGAAEK